MKLINEVIRYAIFTAFTLINGVLCSAIVVEISIGNIIQWGKVTQTKSFKYLVMLFVIMIIVYVIDYITRKKEFSDLQISAVKAIKNAKVFDTIAQEMKIAIQNNDREKFDGLKDFAEKIKELES